MLSFVKNSAQFKYTIPDGAEVNMDDWVKEWAKSQQGKAKQFEDASRSGRVEDELHQHQNNRYEEEKMEL